MKIILMLALLVLLAGCETMPKRVEVAVPVPCKVTMPQKPVWARESVRKGSSGYDIAKATVAELAQREGYIMTLEAALRACDADDYTGAQKSH